MSSILEKETEFITNLHHRSSLLTYVHHLPLMFIICQLCSPYVISDCDMFTICLLCSLHKSYVHYMSLTFTKYHLCLPYVICGCDMFTICHLYQTYVIPDREVFIISCLCSLYVISASDMFTIFHLSSVDHLLSPNDSSHSYMFTIYHLCSMFVIHG